MSNNLTSKQKSYYFGLFAEIVVMVYLFFTFHRILAWRYKTKFGEIDLVARRGRNIVFLEVKARKNKDNNEVLTQHQQKRISDAAKIFLQRNRAYSNLNCRFDLIIFNSGLSLKHIKNSW